MLCLFVSAFVDSRQDGETEDMDISPGSTPTEESMLEKRMNVSSSLPNSVSVSTPMALGSSPVNPQGSGTTEAASTPLKTPTSTAPSSTFLNNTVASLQQALLQASADKSSAGAAAKPTSSSLPTLLASLPTLLTQLQAATGSSHQNSDQQQIMQQSELNFDIICFTGGFFISNA